MHGKTESNTVLVSLMAGLAGAAVALLFAPRSGEETRNQLKDKASEVKEGAEQRMRSAKETAAEKKAEIRDLKDRLAAAVRKSSMEAKEGFEEEMAAGEERT
ncbi:hypothetical protein BH23PAT1_BH23PAT1_5390 [soil metagenome]